MTQEIKIICDSCGKDITYSYTFCVQRCLPSGTIVINYDPEIYEKFYHFCGKFCLKSWVDSIT